MKIIFFLLILLSILPPFALAESGWSNSDEDDNDAGHTQYNGWTHAEEQPLCTLVKRGDRGYYILIGETFLRGHYHSQVKAMRKIRYLREIGYCN